MKKKVFGVRHKSVDKLFNFFFLKFSFRHSNAFSILKKVDVSLKNLNFSIFKISKMK